MSYRSRELMAGICLPLLLMACKKPEGEPTGPRHVWPAEAQNLAMQLPVQEGGRVKPLDTLARFLMLRLQGKRVLRFDNPKRKLQPIEWMLDCLFHPELARKYDILLIEDWDVLDALGLPRGNKRKRDHYSLEYIKPARDRLMELGGQYHDIEQRRRSALQEHIVILAQNYLELERIIGSLDFARARFPTSGYPTLQEVFPGRDSIRFSDILARGRDIVVAAERRREAAAKASPEQKKEAEAKLSALQRMVNDARRAGWSSRMLSFMPPREDEVVAGETFQERGKTWLSPWTVTVAALDEAQPVPEKIPLLAAWERMVDKLDHENPAALVAEMKTLHDDVSQLAAARGEYWKVPMEVSFYKADYFYWSQILFVLGFLMCAFQWLRPASRLLYRATWVVTLIPLGLLTTGIVIRGIIRSRPPVSTLYETFLFITVVAVLAALIAELINRRRVAQFVGALFGATGLFFAMGYEGLEKSDTMPTLQAVLDTNFWLATHVTTVTMGYSASLLAAFVGAIYLLGKLFNLRKDDRLFYQSIGRMTYGILCFGLLFSAVGTILGGIWANDSWGRFWGWDPKENGALMIVLAQLAILHARMGGYLRDFGTCLVAPLLGIVVVFSWFHVNHLGVGLHAYGFSRELAVAMWSTYFVLGTLSCLGVAAWILEQERKTRAAMAAKQAASQDAPDPGKPQLES